MTQTEVDKDKKHDTGRGRHRQIENTTQADVDTDKNMTQADVDKDKKT